MSNRGEVSDEMKATIRENLEEALNSFLDHEKATETSRFLSFSLPWYTNAGMFLFHYFCMLGHNFPYSPELVCNQVYQCLDKVFFVKFKLMFTFSM